MKNLLTAALLVAALTGCVTDPVVRRDPGPSWTEVRTVECRYAGYCYGYRYVPRLDRYVWSYGYSYNCQGRQQVEVKVTPIEIERQSGVLSEYLREEITSYRSVCR